MNRYFAQVEYKGTNYKGFQKQKNSKQTIQLISCRKKIN